MKSWECQLGISNPRREHQMLRAAKVGPYRRHQIYSYQHPDYTSPQSKVKTLIDIIHWFQSRTMDNRNLILIFHFFFLFCLVSIFSSFIVIHFPYVHNLDFEKKICYKNSRQIINLQLKHHQAPSRFFWLIFPTYGWEK